MVAHNATWLVIDHSVRVSQSIVQTLI